MTYNKRLDYSMFCLQSQREFAYTVDCTIIRLSCLTAKALRRITMRSFLVGATESNNHTLKGVQLSLLGL